MKYSTLLFAALPLAGLLGFAHPASAEIVLYSNYTGSNTIGAPVIYNGASVTDSFTLTSTSTLDEVQFAAVTDPGQVINNVDWSIGSGAFGTDDGSGNFANLTDGTAVYDSTISSDIAQDTFSLGGITLGPGTYYLTLSNAYSDVAGGAKAWADSNGPSDAQQTGVGDLNDLNDQPGTHSEAFEILGTEDSTVPEPAGYVPVLTGAALLGLFVIRRKYAARA